MYVKLFEKCLALSSVSFKKQNKTKYNFKKFLPQLLIVKENNSKCS